MLREKQFWLNNIKILFLLVLLAIVFKKQLEMQSHKIEADFIYRIYI